MDQSSVAPHRAEGGGCAGRPNRRGLGQGPGRGLRRQDGCGAGAGAETQSAQKARVKRHFLKHPPSGRSPPAAASQLLWASGLLATLSPLRPEPARPSSPAGQELKGQDHTCHQYQPFLRDREGMWAGRG